MLAARNRPRKVNGWSCSFQKWHTRWFRCKHSGDTGNTERNKSVETEQEVSTLLSQRSLKLFTTNPVVYFLKLDKTRLWHTPKVCSAAVGTQTALGIFQFRFIYFEVSFFKALDIHFSREAQWRYPGSLCS